MRVCCICGKSFDGYGYNPVPIESAGVCCRACNDTLVIPRRLRDYKIERIQQDADALRTNATGKHASAKLNAFVGKPVIVKFWDGSTERGVLHIDTLATRLHSADAAAGINIERNHVYKMDCLDGLRLMARGGCKLIALLPTRRI